MLKLLVNQNRFIKWGLLVLFFVMGYLYEVPEGSRRFILVLGFAVMALGIRTSEREGEKLNLVGVLLSLGGLLLIESYSTYVMNYFFQLLYLIVLIHVLLTIERRRSWLLGGLILVASLRKYIYLYSYQKRPETMAEIVFFVLMTIIVFIACSFGRYYREEKNEKDALLRQMVGQNEALRLYSDKVATLSASEERSRIARDLHDRLGHQLTGLVMELEMIDHLMTDEAKQEKKLIIQAKNDARSTLTMVRQVVESFNEEKDSANEMDFLKLIEEFKERSRFDVKVDNQLADLKQVPWSLIEKVTREGLTNAARHGQSSQVEIDTYCLEDTYILRLWNPGRYESYLGGNGLKGMKERLQETGGRLAIDTTDGFEIKAYLPKEEASD